MTTFTTAEKRDAVLRELVEHKRNPANSRRVPGAFWSAKASDWTWYGQWNGRVGPDWTVTHWMPMPDAPE
jgi:hypothetical protein